MQDPVRGRATDGTMSAMAMTMREAWEQHRGRAMMKLSPYLDAQQRHFARLQGTSPTVLEIGVNKGGSLELWHRYFGPGTRVVGVDIDPACEEFADEHTEIRIGDQADRAFLAELVEAAPFDVVIDDGGHTMDQQIVTFEELWPHVTVGGVYCCEDTLSSYLTDYGGGRGVSGTFMELMKAKVDELNAWFDPQVEPTYFTRSAVSMHFYASMVVIEKGDVGRPQLVGAHDQGVAYGSMDPLLRPR